LDDDEEMVEKIQESFRKENGGMQVSST